MKTDKRRLINQAKFISIHYVGFSITCLLDHLIYLISSPYKHWRHGEYDVDEEISNALHQAIVSSLFPRRIYPHPSQKCLLIYS